MDYIPPNQTVKSDRPRRRLSSRTLQTGGTILYECPSGKSAEVLHLTLCNTHTVTVTVRVHHLLPSEAVGVNNAIFYDLSLEAQSTLTDDGGYTLNAGERIYASASVGSVLCVALYGTES